MIREGLQEVLSSVWPAECIMKWMFLLDAIHVCEQKGAISIMFCKYGTREPNVNCSALNSNVWTLTWWQNGIEARSNQQCLSDEIRILCIHNVIIVAHLLLLIISKTKKLGSVFLLQKKIKLVVLEMHAEMCDGHRIKYPLFLSDFNQN